MGGVERVILNRACAFKQHGLDVRQDVFFLHDSGGLPNFRRFVRKHELSDYVRIVDKIDQQDYDRIISFDTPEIFEDVKEHSKLIVECHSPYKESRTYLKSLPQEVACLVSPSEAFMQSVVQPEIVQGFEGRLYVLPNFHVMEFGEGEGAEPVRSKIWSKKPICYIGRMDAMKNTKELMEIFAKLRHEKNDEYFLMLVGDVRPHYMDISEALKKHHIEDRTAYLRNIPYDKVDVLLRQIREHEGIFVSPSQGESFGLSALEAMVNEVPVLLTGIDCHKALVGGDEQLLYKLGDTGGAADKIKNISQNYSRLSQTAAKLAARYSSAAFIEAWEKMINGIGH